MSSALTELIDILRPVQTGEDRFRGRGSTGDGAPGTYGGHFLGQGVAAALATARDGHALHSLHAYFLRAGRPGEPIDYTVERVRDGMTFSSRRVRASQDDRVAFEMLVSLTGRAEGPLLEPPPPHDFTSLPTPESLPPYHELMARQDPLPLPADWALREHGIDVRVVNAPWSPLGPSRDRGIRMWIRANGELPADAKLHCAALAYQSDESLADNVLVPFERTWSDPGVFCVSLDHALWIHRPLDLNAWHFVEQRAVSLAHSRGLAEATVWSANGQRVASFTQEILLRFDADPN